MAKNIPHFSGGTTSARDKLNAIADEVSVLSKLRGDAKYIAVNKNSAGAIVSLNLQAILSAIPRVTTKLLQAMIYEIGDDVLTCHYIFPDENGVDVADTSHEVLVWKPWTLRRTPFDGKTVNGINYTYVSEHERSAVEGAVEEDQLVTPDYFVNAIIFVAPINVAPVNGYSDDMIDVNVDGRAWAVPP
jgi:hypothetical protein